MSATSARGESGLLAGDPVRDENLALTNRISLLRAVLDRMTSDAADAQRRLARARLENRQLRAALARSEEICGELSSPHRRV